MGAALTFQPALFMIAIFLTVAGLGMIGERLERSSGQLPPPVKPGQLPA